jgi:hypothetical protein
MVSMKTLQAEKGIPYCQVCWPRRVLTATYWTDLNSLKTAWASFLYKKLKQGMTSKMLFFQVEREYVPEVVGLVFADAESENNDNTDWSFLAE